MRATLTATLPIDLLQVSEEPVPMETGQECTFEVHPIEENIPQSFWDAIMDFHSGGTMELGDLDD